MHYRRMQCQPCPQARLIGATLDGKRVYEVHQPGPILLARPPEDMPRAQPWQDSDGEWYWRRDLNKEPRIT
jgi:hypothetical protein